MSDLYIVLRDKLEVVVDWVEIGTPRLAAAQAAKGYSHETMGRLLYVSEKTWRRWLAKGAVPRSNLSNVAAALDLVIHDGAAEPVQPSVVTQMQATLESHGELLRRIQADLAALAALER